MRDKRFHIVLVEPEIPPNTGSIARLCGATDTVLHLVHPLGFNVDDKHLKRGKLYFFTTKVERPYYETSFPPGSFLVFGKETKGLSEEIIALYRDRCYTIPMKNKNIRSLNLAMCAGIVLYEVMRQNT